MKYYIIPIWMGVSTKSLIGPFLCFEDMLVKAREIRAEQREEDGLFWLRLDSASTPTVGEFSNLDLE